MKKILAALLLTSTLLLLCACGSVPGNAGTASGTEAGETPEVIESAAPAEKPEVYFALDESGSYTDSFGSSYTYSYRIPAFSGGSEDAARINKYFDDILRPIVDDELASANSGVSLNVNTINCDVYESGNITSVIVSVCYPNDYIEYYTASMNTLENREMNNADLAAACGVDETALPDYLRAAATTAIEQFYANFGDISGDGFADVAGKRDETLSEIGADEWNPTLFINGEGKVCMISEVMSPVGQYNYIFTL